MGPRPYAVAHVLSNVRTAEPSTGQLTHIDHPPSNTEWTPLRRAVEGSAVCTRVETIKKLPTMARRRVSLISVNLDGFQDNKEERQISSDVRLAPNQMTMPRT